MKYRSHGLLTYLVKWKFTTWNNLYPSARFMDDSCGLLAVASWRVIQVEDSERLSWYLSLLILLKIFVSAKSHPLTSCSRYPKDVKAAWTNQLNRLPHLQNGIPLFVRKMHELQYLLFDKTFENKNNHSFLVWLSPWPEWYPKYIKYVEMWSRVKIYMKNRICLFKIIIKTAFKWTHSCSLPWPWKEM